MNYNWKEAEFELKRKSELIQLLMKNQKDLIRAVNGLQSKIVEVDASDVIDSDSFSIARELLHKFNVC